jgi:hypothetical protein
MLSDLGLIGYIRPSALYRDIFLTSSFPIFPGFEEAPTIAMLFGEKKLSNRSFDSSFSDNFALFNRDNLSVISI